MQVTGVSHEIARRLPINLAGSVRVPSAKQGKPGFPFRTRQCLPLLTSGYIWLYFPQGNPRSYQTRPRFVHQSQCCTHLVGHPSAWRSLHSHSSPSHHSRPHDVPDDLIIVWSMFVFESDKYCVAPLFSSPTSTTGFAPLPPFLWTTSCW